MRKIKTMSLDTLPVILVTAKTHAAAVKLISEIVQEDESLEQIKEEAEEVNWLIQNKYYKAHVQLKPLGDEESVPIVDVEAHVILLGDGEGVTEVEARTARVSAALLLAAAEAERVPSALAEWATRIHTEVVPLRAPPASPTELAEPFGEERGVRRLREALHAYVWPNMRRHGTTRISPEPDLDSEPEDAADEVERAEKFAAALGALGPATRHVTGLSGAERFAAAEALVAEFARALGVSLDDL